MTRDGAVPWSDDQWAKIEGLVQDAARRTRVAASFLPLTGPLPPGQSYIVASQLDLASRHGQLGSLLNNGWPAGSPNNSTYVAEDSTLPLVRLTVPIYLKSSDVDDPQLSTARQIFARAAGIIGRLEDAIVFNGLRRDRDRLLDFDGNLVTLEPQIYVVQAPVERFYGLLHGFDPPPETTRMDKVVHDGQLVVRPAGLVKAVSDSVIALEDEGYERPFACVLGNNLFQWGQQVSLAELAASDRIEPYLGGGPFLRSSTLPADAGVVVALGGEPVDLVIGSDLAVNFLQITPEPRYVLSLSETIRLRVKDRTGGAPWRILRAI